MVYRSPMGIAESHPAVLVVRCTDARFAPHIEQFVTAVLGIRSFETYARPAGPGTFLVAADAHREIRFLLASHGIRRLLLFTHDPCGAYEALYGRSTPALRKLQIAHLRYAASLFSRMPDLTVEAYHATLEEERVVVRAAEEFD